MSKKVLKCTVGLEIHATTCPGVVLKDKDDVYLSVCMLGRYQKTKCVPAVFPLLFHEKLRFEKIFAEAIDPGHIAELLESDTTTFELIQLVPPVGEILATYEENTRDFLYPGPRLTSSYPGSDRELLMKRSVSFPGIAPKLEFSTMSIIKECPLNLEETEAEDQVHRSAPAKKPAGRLPKKAASLCEKSRDLKTAKSYEQPTIASQSRSPSPYTKRRMSELSEDARQRLAHLNLGPYEFKKETDNKPPFVVRRLDKKLSSTPETPLCSHFPLPGGSFGTSWSPALRVYSDPSLLGSYRPKAVKVIREPHDEDRRNGFFRDFDGRISFGPSEEQGRLRHSFTVRSAPSSVRKDSQRAMMNQSSLSRRFQTDPSTPTNWEEIHERVKRILKTHSTRQRLSFVDSDLSKEDSFQKRATSCQDSLCDSELAESSAFPQSTSVHLDDGEYWSNQAALYKGKSHRAVFEESLEKIYRNMYKRASDTS
nr:PREDICTED: spermatogenesis-associated protein 6 isoform X2 [Latimeria chalumnae]|eukprot:XP_005991187.1 PREDICTED: spermatogenesis-associated protein 6 isoform X2 [Latimeria chalumnae]